MKIFLDFDGTTVDSVKAYCNTYNRWFIEKADHTKVNKWNLSDECPKAINYVEDIFASEDFYYALELMDADTYKVLRELKQKYEIVICSIGTPENISRKAKWIERNLEVEDMILLSKSNVVMDKSIIDMSGGIIIDDNEDNLRSSNADIKICFGEIKEWNENWSGLRVSNWKELGELLINKL